MKKKFTVLFNAFLLLFMCSCDKTGNVLVVKSDITRQPFSIKYHHIISNYMPTQYTFFLKETPEQFFESLKSIDGYLYNYVSPQTSEKLVLFFKDDAYYVIKYSRAVKNRHLYNLYPEEHKLNFFVEESGEPYSLYMPMHIIKPSLIPGEEMQAYEDWDYIKEYYQRISSVVISEENKTIEFDAVREGANSANLEYLPVTVTYNPTDNTLRVNQKT